MNSGCSTTHDLAAGVVIVGPRQDLTVMVDKVIMPPIGLLIGGVDFSELVITLKAATVDAAGEVVPAVVIGYGEFINALIQFTIVAFAIFMVVKAINRLNRKPEAAQAPAEIPEDVQLLREIRDALRR